MSRLFSVMWARQAAASVFRLAATRNSSPPSSSGAQAVSTAFTSVSREDIICSTSAMSSFATKAPSRVDTIFFALVSAVFAAASLPCRPFTVSVFCALPWFSFCLAVRKCLTWSRDSCAALACSLTFSQMAFASSFPSFSATSSSSSGVTLSVTLSTSCCSLARRSWASCSDAFFFRASVSFLNDACFCAAELIREVRDVSSSRSGLLFSLSEKARSSTLFAARKFRASVMPSCSSPAAFSEHSMVEAASVRGSTSMPFRNGSSASFTFSTRLSTWSVFFLPSRTYASPRERSRRPFLPASTLSRRSWTFLVRSATLLKASFRAGTGTDRFASTDLVVLLMLFWALTMASPSSAHSSSVGVSTASTGTASFSTLATSDSALSTFTISSARASLPLMSLSP
mmetsp:Transcript_130926/g.310497  ORF Transcript_130926/g.310497 Transcript_130926/m.310497 type:complete len:400 (+) Transcript_130926:2533-3732(+)